MNKRPLIIAHRGDHRNATENTMEAFEAAIAASADMIELDVRRTADGKIVVFHDAHVAGKRIADLTYADVVTASRIAVPRLETVLRLVHDRIELLIEIKEDGSVKEVLRPIANMPGERISIISFSESVVRQVKQLAPRQRVGLLTVPWAVNSVKRAQSLSADLLCLHYTSVWLGQLAAAQRAGIACMLWAVNSPRLLRHYRNDQRIAGIITDRLERTLP